MNNHLDVFARNIGLLGILVSLGALSVRLLGYHRIFEVEAITILQGGIALMVISCVVQLNFLRKP
jgi:hypothetical protein